MHDNVYSTGLTAEVEGRLSLSKKPTCAELKIDLDAPHCVLAAAELFNTITRKFGLPTLTVAAKDYALQQLRGQGNITTGSVFVQQGSADISKLYVLTSGAVGGLRRW